MTMHQPLSFNLLDFDPNTFLDEYTTSNQIIYLRKYLFEIGAQTLLEEPNYFDRDYLSEFSSFYGHSARGYKNICKRIHFFSEKISEETFKKAIGGESKELSLFQKEYLGFIVIRPIQKAPLGKTVLKWYPEERPQYPRITKPSREYKVDICGMELKINGLAWQQQDQGVASCATVALWSMLQSSALDDYHFIPTTSEITEAAHKTASLGSRIYPTKGLTISQICEVLKEVGFAPCLIEGDIKLPNGSKGFSLEKFIRTCTSFIRSGYPVLLAGQLGIPGYSYGYHAICAVGFRENTSTPPKGQTKGQIFIHDKNIHHLYIHDDNLGPSVRFQIFYNPRASNIVTSSCPGKKVK